MNEDGDCKRKSITNVIYPDAFKKSLDNEKEPIEPIERINFLVTLDEIRILTTYRIAKPEGKDLMHSIVNVIAEKAGHEKPFE